MSDTLFRALLYIVKFFVSSFGHRLYIICMLQRIYRPVLFLLIITLVFALAADPSMFLICVMFFSLIAAVSTRPAGKPAVRIIPTEPTPSILTRGPPRK